jgi:hypothetical protein
MNNTDKALNSIIKQNDMRVWMNTPFLLGNYVYSTDAHSLIRFRKEDLSEIYKECSKPNNAEYASKLYNVEFKDILEIKVNDLKKAIDKVPFVEEYENTDLEGKCNECEGSGEVEWEYEGHLSDFDCPVCNGEGSLTESKRIKTGRKVKDEGYFIDINFSRLRIAMIEELIKIASILNVEKVKVVNQTKPNSGIIFKVGKGELIMMPVLLTDEQNIIQRFESLSVQKA